MTESQHTEWKSSWRDDHLRGGRGIDRTFAACREAGTPAPQLRLSGNDLRLEFPYAPSYLRAVSPVRGDESVTEGDGKTSAKTSVKTSVKTSAKTSMKTSVKTSGKTEDMILAMVQGTSAISIPEMAATLGVTPRAVEKQIRQLKARGRLRRVGPAKGGHWEVMP